MTQQPQRVATHAEGATCGHERFTMTGLDHAAGFTPNEIYACDTTGCSVTYSVPDTAEACGFAPDDEDADV